MTQMLDVAKSQTRITLVEDELLLPIESKKTVVVKTSDYDENTLKEKIPWDTAISFSEYRDSAGGVYKKEFTVGIIPETFFINKRIMHPEDVDPQSLGLGFKKLSLFEFVQFSLMVKTSAKKLISNSTYVPIGTRAMIVTKDSNGEIVKNSVFPVCAVSGWIESIGGKKTNLQGSRSPSIQFWLDRKFFVVKI